MPSADQTASKAGRKFRAADLRPTAAFLASFVGLVALPIVPELCLWLRHYDSLRTFATAAYYELVASFLVWWPALVLPRRLSRAFVLGLGVLVALSTLIVGFQAVTVGARWDVTAHIALLETYASQALEFARSFASASTLAWIAAVTAAFAACIIVNVRAPAPSPRHALFIISAGLLFSIHGVRNGLRFIGNPWHAARASDGRPLPIINLGQDGYHPLLQLLTTQWNVSATREYRRQLRLESAANVARLGGATVVPGATPPRTVVFVIGESAGRRHWSLYGYGRPTNPRLGQAGPGLVLFRDTIARTVGTVTEIRGMLCAPGGVPIIALFGGAGYKTSWFSTQFDHPSDDLNITALAQACDRREYLTGALDENLVPLVRAEIARPGSHFIILHLTGSHVRYDDRYPRQFAAFHGDGEKEHRLAAYDNSILYTDSVLAEVIRVLRERPEPSCFVYASDHGEDVYDSDSVQYRFRSDSVATDPMYEVPFIVWFSPTYRELNPAVVAAAEANRDKPFQTLGLYATLVDLARLRHPVYDGRMSIVSAEFAPRPRVVGAMSRPYPPRSPSGQVLSPLAPVHAAAHGAP